MSKIRKICLVIAIVCLLVVIGDYSIAQGKGYFLAKGEELFVFDNLFVNGYLVIEDQVNLNTTGLPGDVLLSGNFLLDPQAKFYFCANQTLQREGMPSLAQNTNCQEKVMIWNSEANATGLELLNNDYQIQANNIVVSGDTFTLQAAANSKIKTNKPVYVKNGCFSNNGTTCSAGELKTDKIFLDTLNNWGLTTNRNQINLTAAKVDFAGIKFEEDYDFNRQSICFKAPVGTNCNTTYPGSPIGKVNMTTAETNFVVEYLQPYQVPYDCSETIFGITFPKTCYRTEYEEAAYTSGLAFGGNQVCCYLNISNF